MKKSIQLEQSILRSPLQKQQSDFGICDKESANMQYSFYLLHKSFGTCLKTSIGPGLKNKEERKLLLLTPSCQSRLASSKVLARCRFFIWPGFKKNIGSKNASSLLILKFFKNTCNSKTFMSGNITCTFHKLLSEMFE